MLSMNEHLNNLPLALAQALPLLRDLPAPSALITLLVDW
jgi:hypothetical protein